MMCFEAAMERQRHRQEILDDSTIQKIPRFKTKLAIERYAQKKYTKTMFTLIQEEINSAVYDCHQISEILENGIETVTIKEIREIKVNTSRKKLEVIPDKYILKRWTRDLLPPHIRIKKQMFGFECSRYMECSATVYSAVDYCLKLLAKDEDKLLQFVENVKRLKTEVEEANPNAKQLRGQKKKSEIEKLREHMKKHKRLCKKCEKYRRHDSRNCPKKDDEIPTDSDSTDVGE
nr:hypothetical protein [Tanacetum cinerariifolium]